MNAESHKIVKSKFNVGPLQLEVKKTVSQGEKNQVTKMFLFFISQLLKQIRGKKKPGNPICRHLRKERENVRFFSKKLEFFLLFFSILIQLSPHATAIKVEEST